MVKQTTENGGGHFGTGTNKQKNVDMKRQHESKKKRVNQRTLKEMRVIWTAKNIRLKTVG